jgi:hypothetical protein
MVAASLKLMDSYWGTNALKDYRYAPGLTAKDPAHFVLFYVKEPCRRLYHGDVWSPSRPRRWIVLSPGIANQGGTPEFAYAWTTAEFTQRLGATLEFLKAQQRPGWSNAVMEHRAFLESIR